MFKHRVFYVYYCKLVFIKTGNFRLDQQIWGSDDEEEEENKSNKKEKEERGAGESTGEKEMGAKEEEQGADDGSEGKEKKQKKDVNEMEENELDDDQVISFIIFCAIFVD